MFRTEQHTEAPNTTAFTEYILPQRGGAARSQTIMMLKGFITEFISHNELCESCREDILFLSVFSVSVINEASAQKHETKVKCYLTDGMISSESERERRQTALLH